MERQISTLTRDGYPYYLHNNREFVDYWNKYFDQYPIKDTDRIEIYIDFPFCRSICDFCVYGSLTTGEYKDRIKLYEDAMISLSSDMRDVFPCRINNVYFGGGTPSLWPKDSLLKIINNIPVYESIPQKAIEVHPVDLTDEWIEFITEDLKIKTVSIGVQSFDIKSNRDQKRIPADVNKLTQAVETLHNNGIWVNIDVVALFNLNGENGWDIYKNDLEILANIVKPDDISGSVNYHTENFYSKTIKYRQILKEFLDKYPQYSLEHPDSISLDINDIIRYEEEPYHMRTKEYHEFFNGCRVGILDRRPDIVQQNIIIGLGGSSKHNAISRSGMKFEDINSYFSFDKNKFIHIVKKTRIGDYYKDGDKIPSIRIGNCNLDNNLE